MTCDTDKTFSMSVERQKLTLALAFTLFISTLVFGYFFLRHFTLQNGSPMSGSHPGMVCNAERLDPNLSHGNLLNLYTEERGLFAWLLIFAISSLLLCQLIWYRYLKNFLFVAQQRLDGNNRELDKYRELQSIHFSLYEDILLQQKTLEASFEKSSMLGAIIESSNESILVHDQQGNINYCNSAAERTFQYKRDEIFGKNISVLSAYMDSEPHPPSTTLNYSVNYNPRRILRKNGTTVDMEMSRVAIASNNGTAKKFAVICRNITDLIKISRQNSKLIRSLQQKNRDMKHFSYFMSHDLRTPLRSIAILISWIEDEHRKASDPQSLKTHMHQMKTCIQTMDSLINWMVRYNNLDLDEHKVETFSLRLLIDNALNVLLPPSTIKIEIEENLPFVTFNKIHLQHVIQNIIGNAIKYVSPENGLIRIHVDNTEDDWVVKIQDNGCGIQKNLHEKIFELFYSHNTRNNGNGIGLAFAKKMMEKHHGTIEVESEEGKGCTFSVRIPKFEHFQD